MKKSLILTVILFLASTQITTANSQVDIQIKKDSTRLAELDLFWTELSRTVREGDFEGYKNTYHKDAVIIFASGKNKTSVSIGSALKGWKQGFLGTKAGKIKADVKFRFSQRIGNNTTAHETGIFFYSSGKNIKQFIHFEMLFVKKNTKWLGVMEYQKSNATQKEWDALK
mgnify:CR=1 FL=1